LVVMPAVGDLRRRRLDGAGNLPVQSPGAPVNPGGGLLDDGKGVDERRRHFLAADREVGDGALRLGAPISIVRNRDIAETVRLGAGHGVLPYFLRLKSTATTLEPSEGAAAGLSGWSFSAGSVASGGI